MAATALQRFLHLPGALRQETLTLRAIGHHRINIQPTFRRSFTSNPCSLAKAGTPPPASAPSPPRKAAPPPPASSAPPAGSRQARSGAVTVLATESIVPGNSDLLLYAAPRHGGFARTSYTAGALFILGGVTTFSFALEPPKSVYNSDDDPSSTVMRAATPWYMKPLSTISALGMAVVGTTFLIAPTALVRSITLLRGSSGAVAAGRKPLAVQSRPRLRFEMRPLIPYLGLPRDGKTIEVDAADVTLDLKVRAAEVLENYSVTAKKAAAAKTPEELLAGAPQGQRRSMVGAAIHNVLRMFVREGFVYLRIEKHGLWKMDLHHCAIVDGGKPLGQMTKQDANLNRGIFGKLQLLFGSR